MTHTEGEAISFFVEVNRDRSKTDTHVHTRALWPAASPVLLCCIRCSLELEENHCAWIKRASNVPKALNKAKSHTLNTDSMNEN